MCRFCLDVGLERHEARTLLEFALVGVVSLTEGNKSVEVIRAAYKR